VREIKKLGSELCGFFTRSAGGFAIAVSGLAVVVWLCYLISSIDVYRSPKPSSVQLLQLSDQMEILRVSIFVCVVSLTAWALAEWVLRRRGVVVEPRWLVGVPWRWRFVGAMGLWALGTVGSQTVLMLSGSESMNVPTSADYSQPAQLLRRSRDDDHGGGIRRPDRRRTIAPGMTARPVVAITKPRRSETS
jgi:hypothetical protein